MKTEKDRVAAIRLQGYPYHQEVDGKVIDCTDTLERLAQSSGYESRLQITIGQYGDCLRPLVEGGYYGIDAKLKKGEALTYEEAFSLMTFVSMGVNKKVHEQLSGVIKVGAMDQDTIFYQSIALLSAMSAKEAFAGLTPPEIAGMTAAALEIDTIVRVPGVGETYGIGGMGGDRGYPKNGENSKLFSLSTLGSLVLANEATVHKHHSYPNTSKVAGQSAIEAFGASSHQDSLEALTALQEGTGLLMSSCHTLRLIHTLSHRLKGETINHVVGPLALPIDKATPINAFIGVNDNVHPETIIEALKILGQRGIQRYENSVAFCGLNEGLVAEHFEPAKYYGSKRAKQAVVLDEVAPPPHETLAAFLVGGENKGTYVLKPEDFMDPKQLAQIDYKKLLIANNFESIMAANRGALRGEDQSKALYLAMTGALAVFTREYAHLRGALNYQSRRVNPIYMRDAFQRVSRLIENGKGLVKLEEYVKASNG